MCMCMCLACVLTRSVSAKTTRLSDRRHMVLLMAKAVPTVVGAAAAAAAAPASHVTKVLKGTLASSAWLHVVAGRMPRRARLTASGADSSAPS